MFWLVQGKRHGRGSETRPRIVGKFRQTISWGKEEWVFLERKKTSSFFVLCSSFFFHCWESCLSNNSLIKCYVIQSRRQCSFHQSRLLIGERPEWRRRDRHMPTRNAGACNMQTNKLHRWSRRWLPVVAKLTEQTRLNTDLKSKTFCRGEARWNMTLSRSCSMERATMRLVVGCKVSTRS